MAKLDEKAIEGYFKKVRATNYALGLFIVEFSQMEFTLKFIAARWLGIPDRHVDAAVGWWDVAKLCHCLKALNATDRATELGLKKAYDKLLSAALSVNSERVKLVHSTWTLGKEGLEARRVTADKPTATWLFADSKEIDRLRETAQSINARLIATGIPKPPAAAVPKKRVSPLVRRRKA